MKIKNKRKYVFKRNKSCNDFNYEIIPEEEIKRFIYENIEYKDDSFFYEGDHIYSYITIGDGIKILKDMYIQVGIRKCIKVHFLSDNDFEFTECFYNNNLLKCFLLGEIK